MDVAGEALRAAAGRHPGAGWRREGHLWPVAAPAGALAAPVWRRELPARARVAARSEQQAANSRPPAPSGSEGGSESGPQWAVALWLGRNMAAREQAAIPLGRMLMVRLGRAAAGRTGSGRRVAGQVSNRPLARPSSSLEACSQAAVRAAETSPIRRRPGGGRQMARPARRRPRHAPVRYVTGRRVRRRGGRCTNSASSRLRAGRLSSTWPPARDPSEQSARSHAQSRFEPTNSLSLFALLALRPSRNRPKCRLARPSARLGSALESDGAASSVASHPPPPQPVRAPPSSA